ncbi:MAG: GNAT family N-acetyltransferase [Eubacteriaceae bacterium]|nr:GNAT family N-acetyltransferase [Eubacteriaceae bacterium]
MGIELTDLEVKDFEEIYNLMNVSFQKEEIRTYENGVKQLSEPNYRILVSKTNNDEIAGFIAQWDLESVIFIEHFAVKKELRGSGIGSAMLKAYLNKANKLVVLEVEDNEMEIGKRRIGFYQRMGFFLSDFGYLQPILRGDGKKEIPLKLMSFPEELSKQGFLEFKTDVFTEIYKITR